MAKPSKYNETKNPGGTVKQPKPQATRVINYRTGK